MRPPTNTTGLYDGGVTSNDQSRVVSSDEGKMLEQTMNIADGKVYGEAFEYDDLPTNITHVVLQNGGYGNIVYSLMYLLQKRIVKYFNGEYFDDVEFSNQFLNLYDMLLTQEHVIESPIAFSKCLAEIAHTIFNLKFTKMGVRIAG